MIDIILETGVNIPDCGMTLEEMDELIERVAEHTLKYCKTSANASVLLTDNAGIRQINKDFRKIDSETDVLSFPAFDGGCETDAVTDKYLGDIAISLERAFTQSIEYGHSFSRELAFLTAHGMLHILGYDHMTTEEEKEMFDIQKKILLEMGLSR